MALDRTKYNDDETTHHRGSKVRRHRGNVKMQLNLTSMIDVVFQLLIYFVVTATFIIDEGLLAAKLPTGPGEPKPIPELARDSKIFVRSVDRYNYQINIEGYGRVEGFDELQRILKEFQVGSGSPAAYLKQDDPVKIIPDRDVMWQHVVNTFNAARAAKYTNVTFAEAEG